MKKKKTMLILTLVFTAIFAVYGALISLFGVHYSAEKSDEFHISTPDDFYKYLEDYEVYKTVYLEANIEISEEHAELGSKDKIFNSVFDGKGYKITLTGSACNQPLFNIIGENGVVKNLELSSTKSVVEKSAFGLLANQNNGSIKNINLTLNELVIKQDSIVGGLVAINNGDVSYCHISTKIINSIDKQRKQSIVSGCVGYNNGSISSIIVSVKFEGFSGTNQNNIIQGTLNNNIGYVSGTNNKNIVSLLSCYYVSNDNYFTSDVKYMHDLHVIYPDFDEIILLDTLHFDNRVWKLSTVKNSKMYAVELKDGVSA